jgi:putative SOS response-associated peptidase YedK
MTQQTNPSDVARIFDAELRDEEPFQPSFNVAPTDPVTVVLQREDGRVVERHRWGLIPAWADSPAAGARMINARAETILASPAFRVAFRRRRCIVPADGFYEWLRRGGNRQAFFLHAAGGTDAAQLLAMAGLWSLWKDPATGAWLSSCAVVTTEASDQVASIHDRMPVMLARDAWLPWLDPDEKDLGYLRSLLVPAPNDALDVYPVSSRVNSVRNNGPELILPVEPPVALEQATLFG